MAFPGQELDPLYLCIFKAEDLPRGTVAAQEIKEDKMGKKQKVAYFLQRLKRVFIADRGEGVRKSTLTATYLSTPLV